MAYCTTTDCGWPGMLCYVIIKGDPFSHGLVSMGDPTVQGHVKQGQDNTKHAQQDKN